MASTTAQQGTASTSGAVAPPTSFEVVVVGSGFAGIGMGVKLQELGIHSYVVLEKASEVGGTWRDNSYPGAACDVPSHLYSFSFAQNPNWSRTYPTQAEIQDYLVGVATGTGVREHCRFNEAVERAEWDEETQSWLVVTTKATLRCRVLVWATGPLSEAKLPDLEGMDRFQGLMVHTSAWGEGQPIAGKRVGVIGSGASAIQLVPSIVGEVAELTVFQRTPNWVLPRDDQPVPAWRKALYRAFAPALSLRRLRVYVRQEMLAPGLLGKRSRVYGALKKFAREHLANQVADPELRETLRPTYPVGCKRVLVSNDWYPALQRENVTLVPLAAARVTERGVVDAEGHEHEVDVIVFATGFEAANPSFARYVTGRGGLLLAEAWRDGMEAYLGSSVPGFPNLFCLAGPNTILGHNSVVYMIESQLNQVSGAIAFLFGNQLGSLEVTQEAERAWSRELAQRFKGTVWTSGDCSSWYLNASGKNTTLWPGMTYEFRRRTKHFHPADYEVEPRRSLATS